MSIDTAKSDDVHYSKSIAKSISEILRFSLDEKFRQSIFDLFGVSSSNDVEKEIHKRLMLILQNKNSAHSNIEKEDRNLVQEKDKKNVEEHEDNFEKSQESSSLSSESQSFVKNLYQEKWLRISSEQYKNVIKRKKANFFSQPQISSTNQRDIRNPNFSFSYSQPALSSSPCSSPLSKKIKLPTELSNDGINYCKEMFKESLEENAHKYFQSNLRANYTLDENFANKRF